PARRRHHGQRPGPRGGRVHRGAPGLEPAPPGVAGVRRHGRTAGRGPPGQGPVAGSRSGAADASAARGARGRLAGRAGGSQPGRDKRMSTLVKVARYHLVQPVLYLAIAWGVLAFGFAVNVIIFATNPATATDPDPRYTGALSSFFTLCFVRGWYTIGKSLPFGLTLGVSRRAYYLGTALLAVVLACADGLALTGLQAIERATGGWGVDMGFFRVPYLLGGRGT